MMADERQATAYPGPASALRISISALGALFCVAVVFAGVHPLTSLGIGEALGVGFVATWAARRVAVPQAERLGLRGFAPHWILPLVGLLPLALLAIELRGFLSLMFPPPELSEAVAEVAALLDSESFYGRLQHVVIAVGIAPVVQEWLFRGVVQQGLVARLGRLRGVVLTSALYAPLQLSLGEPNSSLVAALSVTLMLSLALGTVRLATGSLLAPILLSAGLNALMLASLWARQDAAALAGDPVQGSASLVYVIAAAGIVWLASAPFLRAARSAPIWIAEQVREADRADQ
jgi:membrane protease YdiL (CAAX protease family)